MECHHGLPPSKAPSRLSVFDLDHTLLKVNTSYCFGWYLYQKGFFSFRTLVRCLSTYGVHKFGFISIPQLHRQTFRAIFYERFLSQVSGFVQPFLDQQLDSMVNIAVQTRLQEAQKEGEYTAILSSSPDFLVRPIAERLGINLWRATKYLTTPSGRFQEVNVFAGEDKANAIKEMSKDLKIDLSHITVFSDSFLDLPMLLIAGKAVAVSPDSRLKKWSVNYGWEII